MIKIEDIKRFLSNDFRNAILSGRVIDGKLDLRLSLKEKSNIKYQGIPCYSENLFMIRKDSIALCNYLFDVFLANNTIIGVSYFVPNQYHDDKTCFDIKTENGKFTLAFKDRKISEIIPDFVAKVEFAKREGIIQYLQDYKSKISDNTNYLGSHKPHFCLDTKSKFRSGIDSSGSYQALSLFDGNQLILYPKEEKFLKIWLKEMLEISSCFTSKSLEEILADIDRNISRINKKDTMEAIVDFSKRSYQKYPCSIDNLKLLRTVIEELKPFFTIFEEEPKQLVLEQFK